MMTTKEAAAAWGVSPRRVNALCAEGVVDGAQKIGRDWMIPSGASRPPIRRRGKARSNASNRAPNQSQTNQHGCATSEVDQTQLGEPDSGDASQ